MQPRPRTNDLPFQQTTSPIAGERTTVQNFLLVFVLLTCHGMASASAIVLCQGLSGFTCAASRVLLALGLSRLSGLVRR